MVMRMVTVFPESFVTRPVKPGTLLVTFGRPEKLYPVTVTDVVLPLLTVPTSRTAFGADEIDTVVATDTPTVYGATAALVAVTMQVPALVAFRAA